MACLDDNTVQALLEGRLAADRADGARAHLSACDDCRRLVSALDTRGPGTAPHPLAGQLLGDTYRLSVPVGSGGMGTVFAAEHVRLGRTVAVKILSEPLRQHPEALDRFRREALISAGLGSRHIVDVLDFNRMPDGTPFMVMELLDGEDLAERLALRGPLSPEVAVALLKQLCSALAAAHAREIIHRDLKPSNVFLCHGDDDVPFVKVLDFGISKARTELASLTGSREILGTPLYMSPEMATARHQELDHRADLFSVGAIAYEALTGRRAFAAESIPSVLYRVVHDHPPPPAALRPEIPAWLSDLVMQLLAKNPEERPRDARTVTQLLDERRTAAPPATVTGPGPVSVPRPGPPASTSHATSVAPWRIVLWALLAALAGLVGVTAWWYRSGRPSQTSRTAALPAALPRSVDAASRPADAGAEAGSAPRTDSAAGAPVPAPRPARKERRQRNPDTDPLL